MLYYFVVEFVFPVIECCVMSEGGVLKQIKCGIKMTYNFREICRLCLGKKESLTPLFREQVPDTATSLPAKIMSFVPVLKVCFLFPLEGLGSLSNACCV